jgi:hypothetical protein
MDTVTVNEKENLLVRIVYINREHKVKLEYRILTKNEKQSMVNIIQKKKINN